MEINSTLTRNNIRREQHKIKYATSRDAFPVMWQPDITKKDLKHNEIRAIIKTQHPFVSRKYDTET